mgnify:CR=1 FL=1
MAKEKEIKTNAMRILERMKIPYEMRTYECDEFTDGIHVADLLGISQSYISRLEKRIMKRLRKEIARYE